MTANNLTDSLKDLLTEISNYSILTIVIPNLILAFFILGLIGFLGNTFTYLQMELRSNPCCIYAYCSSIIDIFHLSICIFPDYFQTKYRIILPWNHSMFLCKFYGFISYILPQLANNFLILSIFDRFSCTCSFTSCIYRSFQIKFVPRIICSSIVLSCILCIYKLFLTYHDPLRGCRTKYPEIDVILEIIINGLIQPFLMLILILLTLRNIRLSHRRVGIGIRRGFHLIRNHFIKMILTQVLVTSILSIQWVIGEIFVLIRQHQVKTVDETIQMIIIASFANVFYSLNNVKSFYFSIIFSKFFRNTFIKSLKKLFIRRC